MSGFIQSYTGFQGLPIKLSYSSFNKITIVITLKNFSTYRTSPKGNNYNFPLPVAIIRVVFYQSLFKTTRGQGGRHGTLPPQVQFVLVGGLFCNAGQKVRMSRFAGQGWSRSIPCPPPEGLSAKRRDRPAKTGRWCGSRRVSSAATSFGHPRELVFCEVETLLSLLDSKVVSGINLLGRLQEMVSCEEWSHLGVLEKLYFVKKKLCYL